MEKNAFVTLDSLEPVIPNRLPLRLLSVAIPALIMDGRPRGMEMHCFATMPPLAMRRRGTRERRGDAPAPKGTLVPPSKIRLLGFLWGAAEVLRMFLIYPTCL